MPSRILLVSADGHAAAHRPDLADHIGRAGGRRAGHIQISAAGDPKAAVEEIRRRQAEGLTAVLIPGAMPGVPFYYNPGTSRSGMLRGARAIHQVFRSGDPETSIPGSSWRSALRSWCKRRRYKGLFRPGPK